MGNAIQAQILQIEGTAAPDDYDRLSQWWLRRQYDIAIQQHSFDEHTLINISPDAGTVNKNSILVMKNYVHLSKTYLRNINRLKV